MGRFLSTSGDFLREAGECAHSLLRKNKTEQEQYGARPDPIADANVKKKPKPVKPVSRSRKSAGKREAIIRSAIEIINAKSFALASMHEIAAALDLRDATLYYYFPNKRALAYACHRRSLERFEQQLLEVDQAGGTGAEKLKQFVHSFLLDSARHGAHLYFGDYSYLDAAQRKAITAWADQLKDVLVKFLKEGIEDGSVVQCEPEYVVQLLLGMLIWLAKWNPTAVGWTVERLMQSIDAFSFQGLESRAPSSGKKRP